MQSFGHGAPSSYGFQYSACTGRRKALLIGINYFNQKGQLRGCINDVKNMSTYLNGNFGYAREDMVILTDDQQNPMSQPTKQNILRAMHWLVKDAKPNDSLFFHYSGHGGQTPDLDGDEEDGYDEVIYPVDFRVVGHIVDDEMHRIMVNSLQPGVRLTAIFDSCHSGSALDLPYIYSTQGVLKEPNLAKEAGQGLLGIVSAYARGDMGGMASTAMGFLKKATKGEQGYEKAKQTKTSPADVIMWSGSKDTQTSYVISVIYKHLGRALTSHRQDAQIAGQATGAMSWAFITALKKNPQQSYVQLLNSIRDELESKYTQKPQLSCSHPLGMFIPPPSSFFPSFYFSVLSSLEYFTDSVCRHRSFVRHVKHGRNEILPKRKGNNAGIGNRMKRARQSVLHGTRLSDYCRLCKCGFGVGWL